MTPMLLMANRDAFAATPRSCSAAGCRCFAPFGRGDPLRYSAEASRDSRSEARYDNEDS